LSNTWLHEQDLDLGDAVVLVGDDLHWINRGRRRMSACAFFLKIKKLLKGKKKKGEKSAPGI
jgi:hypothetical protein